MPQPRAVHRDGNLIELKSRSAVIQATPQERQQFFQEIRAIAQLRGYKDGWTGHKFKDRFGDFPPWDYRTLQPATPSDATLRWVKSRQIAWAKGRARAMAS